MKQLITILFIVRLFILGNPVADMEAKDYEEAKYIRDCVQYHLDAINLEHHIIIQEEKLWIIQKYKNYFIADKTLEAKEQ